MTEHLAGGSSGGAAGTRPSASLGSKFGFREVELSIGDSGIVLMIDGGRVWYLLLSNSLG